MVIAERAPASRAYGPAAAAGGGAITLRRGGGESPAAIGVYAQARPSGRGLAARAPPWGILEAMPRQLPRALDELEAWPVRAGGRSAARETSSEPLARYLDSLGVWQAIGFGLDAPLRQRIAALWRRRPDLRDWLAEAVGYHVCDEFRRPFLRTVLAGGRGACGRWVAAYSELRAPLVEHHLARTRRFNHPFDVVGACLVLTRELGAAPDTWRAAALAIHRDDRRQTTRSPPSDFLRHDLDTHGTVTPAEGAIINRYLGEVGAPPLDVMAPGMWWQPRQRSRGEQLALVAQASQAYAGRAWCDDDARHYRVAVDDLDPADRQAVIDTPGAPAWLVAAARASLTDPRAPSP